MRIRREVLENQVAYLAKLTGLDLHVEHYNGYRLTNAAESERYNNIPMPAREFSEMISAMQALVIRMQKSTTPPKREVQKGLAIKLHRNSH